MIGFLVLIKPIRERFDFFMLQFNSLDRPEDRPNTLQCHRSLDLSINRTYDTRAAPLPANSIIDVMTRMLTIARTLIINPVIGGSPPAFMSAIAIADVPLRWYAITAISER